MTVNVTANTNVLLVLGSVLNAINICVAPNKSIR